MGKVIHVKFLEFETEAKVDRVYFFDGEGTHDKIMAAYSGPDIPPELTIKGVSLRSQAEPANTPLEQPGGTKPSSGL